MSRVGKQIIIIPDKTTVSLSGGALLVKGPKGELTRSFKPDVAITVGEKEITLKPERNNIFTRSLWGTYASHISNMIQGVNKPFEKKLIVEGIGYRAEMKGKSLVLQVGFSHPVEISVPEGLSVTAEKNVISVSGTDKESVGEFTAKVRAVKKPEPYKGKGIRYDGEVIRRKQGKKTA